VIASNLAVRLGLRAASRNAELAFSRALLDQFGALLSFLPVALFGILLVAAAFGDLASYFATARSVFWASLGAGLVAVAVSGTASALFWAGALPLLAADVEIDRRPPPGNFAPLASRGFARVLLTALLAQVLVVLIVVVAAATILAAVPFAAVQKGPAQIALVALLVTGGIFGVVLADLVGRFWLLRSAAFGEGATVAFGKACSLLAARLGQALIVTLAFLLLGAIVAGVSALFAGVLSGSFFDPDATLLAIAPRLAIGLAFAAVFSWLEVGRMAAFAAIACDAEGLLGPATTPPQPPPPMPEPVIEALPIAEALPADAQEVVEALPVDDDPG
jgi:hypothetical protein